MDLVGLLLIGAVLVFGSVYVGWVSWAAWQEARLTAQKSRADGSTLTASTWLQPGLTLLLSAVFLLVALCMCFSMAQNESYATAVRQLRSLTASEPVLGGVIWGEGENRGTLHFAPSSDERRITGASLAYIQFDNADLKHVTQQYPHICWYILSGTQIDDRALELLAQNDDIEALVLTDTAITDRGIAAFYEHPHLRELDVTRTAITDRGLQVIGSLPHLTHLTVSQVRLTDEGIKALEGKQELATLNLQKTSVSDAAIRTLATLQNLTFLQVRDCQLSPTGIARLRRALPECEISADDPEAELDVACLE